MFGRKLGPAIGSALGEITGRRVEPATTGMLYPIRIYGKPTPYITGGHVSHKCDVGTVGGRKLGGAAGIGELEFARQERAELHRTVMTSGSLRRASLDQRLLRLGIDPR